jgi:tRNA_anti-like
MKKRIIPILIAVLLAGLAYGFYLYNKPRPDISKVPPSVIIDAGSLYQDYQKDEASSDKKYLDKIIQVNGTVTEVEQTDSSVSIELSGTGTGGVNCSIINADRKKMDVPQKGSLVKIKGRCSGFLMDVNIVDCTIMN